MENFNRNPSEDPPSGAQLRKTLNIMFPKSYIRLYHLPPYSPCSLFNVRLIKQNNISHVNSQDPLNKQKIEVSENLYEASSEPSSRARIAQLREQFNLSLIEHQAKPIGLCPIRRAIYDQCFDELIRQVTVGCIEQGLLLFKIRNEIRMTINYFKKIYESGVKFGLNKAIEAELRIEEINSKKTSQYEGSSRGNDSQKSAITATTLDSRDHDHQSSVQQSNELDSLNRTEKYYQNELEKKEQIIIQQRNIIQALTKKYTDGIKSPLL